jgi:hypothetical protein
MNYVITIKMERKLRRALWSYWNRGNGSDCVCIGWHPTIDKATLFPSYHADLKRINSNEALLAADYDSEGVIREVLNVGGEI